MFNIFKKKKTLKIGQVWRYSGDGNPFQTSEWRTRITGLKNGWVGCIPFYFSNVTNSEESIGEAKLWEHYSIEKDFRKKYNILVSE